MVLYIGNHTSSSKGYAAMGRQMVKNGGNTFAFFTRNPRGGKAKEIDPADVQKFLELAGENHFGKLVAHAPYTMNACAAKENLRDFARKIMEQKLELQKLRKFSTMFLTNNKVPQFFWKPCPARALRWAQRFRN